MICPRGSECTESTHEVKTLPKAREWFPGAEEKHLPITVNQSKAYNGRIMAIITDRHGAVVYRRG